MKKVTYSINSGEFTADRLLPCPFCGGSAKFTTTGNDRTRIRKAEIKCTKCHVTRATAAMLHNLEWCGRKAVELWNMRWKDGLTKNNERSLLCSAYCQCKNGSYNSVGICVNCKKEYPLYPLTCLHPFLIFL